MNNRERLPELLSPAGDMDCLKAAVGAGCDAVYLGGSQFNARQGRGQFFNWGDGSGSSILHPSRGQDVFDPQYAD